MPPAQKSGNCMVERNQFVPNARYCLVYVKHTELSPLHVGCTVCVSVRVCVRVHVFSAGNQIRNLRILGKCSPNRFTAPGPGVDIDSQSRLALKSRSSCRTLPNVGITRTIIKNK